MGKQRTQRKEFNNLASATADQGGDEKSSIDIEKGVKVLLTILRHDLKNKIQIITGYLQLLEETGLDEAQKELVEKIFFANDKTEEFIEKVGFYKDILNRGDIRPVTLSMHIREALKMYEETLKECGISIDCELQDFEVKGHPLLLEGLFANLIENVVRHSDGTLIRISVKESGTKVVVTVEDDGKGIPHEQKEDIFDCGYRGAGSSGFGLGLYFVDIITKTCGGQVELKESGSGGARFEITLDKA